MGVTGLWDLLSPAGLRVHPSTLEGRIVAVDSSIWLVQFLRAMRDTSGNIQRGAHLIGFFRRLCKLLFYRIRPVIVFDGPPPALKRATLLQRQQLRELQERGLKRAAEKLLLNRLKQKVITAAVSASATTSTSTQSVDTETASTKPNSHVPCNGGVKETVEIDLEDTSGKYLHFLGPELTEPLGGDATKDTSKLDIFSDDLLEDDEALANATSRRARRVAYYNSIPAEFTGFLAGRRRLDDISINASGLDNVLAMPEAQNIKLLSSDVMRSPHPQAAKIFRNTDDFKEYRVVGENGEERFIQLPLDSSIDPDVFKELPSKLQYSILSQIRDAWFNEARLRTIQAKDNVEVFSNVQIESFLRHVRTTKELEKVKKVMANEVHAQMSAHGGTAGSSESFLVEGVTLVDEGAKNEEEVASVVHSMPLDESSGHFEYHSTSSTGPLLQPPRTASSKPTPVLSTLFASKEATPRTRGKRYRKAVSLGLLEHALPGTPLKGVAKIAPASWKSLIEESGAQPSLLKGNPLEAWQEIHRLTKMETADNTVTATLHPKLDVKEHAASYDNLTDDIFGDFEVPSQGTSSSAVEQATSRSNNLPSRTIRLPRKVTMVKKQPTFSRIQEATPPQQQPSPSPDDWGDAEFIDAASGQSVAAPSLSILEKPLEDTDKKLQHDVPIPLVPVASIDSTAFALQSSPVFDALSQSHLNAHGMASSACSRNVLLDLHVSSIPTNLHLGPLPQETSEFNNVVTETEVHASDKGSVNSARAAEFLVAQKCDPAHTRTENSVTRIFERVATSEGQPDTVTQQQLLVSNDIKITGAEATADLQLELDGQGSFISEKIIQIEAKGDTGDSTSSRQDASAVEKVRTEARTMPQGVSVLESVMQQTPNEQKSVPQHETPISCDNESEDRATTEPLDKQTSTTSNETVSFLMRSSVAETKKRSAVLSPTEKILQDVDKTTSVGDVEKTFVETPDSSRPAVSLIDLEEESARLSDEQNQLEAQLFLLKRGAEIVTPEMQQEVQELLELFGVPYVVAPAEAEAQCAALTELGLCDAVLSDDSDSIVFGAQEVYRKFFETRSTVEMYRSDAVYRKLGLSRSDLIQLAMLLGCDYTVGVRGIGIVNAVEALKVFPGFEGLIELKEWSQDPGRLKHAGISDADSPQKKAYKDMHKRYRLEWIFPEVFPDKEVWDSFASPRVNVSREGFTWGSIDTEGVLRLMRRKAGLRDEVLHETLEPVLKQLHIRPAVTRQLRISDFFQPEDDGPAGEVRSARMHRALGLSGDAPMQFTKKRERRSQKAKTTPPPAHASASTSSRVFQEDSHHPPPDSLQATQSSWLPPEATVSSAHSETNSPPIKKKQRHLSAPTTVTTPLRTQEERPKPCSSHEMQHEPENPLPSRQSGDGAPTHSGGRQTARPQRRASSKKRVSTAEAWNNLTSFL